MRVVVLGPIQAFTGDGTQIDIGGPRLRMLLARLALTAGDVVSTDTLWETTLSNGLTLRGGGGSAPGSETLVMGTTDGKHTIAMHTNSDSHGPLVFAKILEAEFGARAF